MKHFIMALGLLMSAFTFSTQVPTNKPSQLDIPAYAKLGLRAVNETKQKYPNANIIDYSHIGSETHGDATIEKFKLWLKDDHHEFGVIVHITFTTKTGEFRKIDFTETDR